MKRGHNSASALLSTTAGVAVTIGAAMLMAASASAQTVADGAATARSTPDSNSAAQADGAAGEIIVTAQKRSESLQSVPLSISAFGGSDLASRNINTIADVASLAPGVNFGQDQSLARITIRGIGVSTNGVVGGEGSVAVNVDGVFYSQSVGALASFYDVSRVEVLRGPQGTLYGRNATGGSVNIITNNPVDYFDLNLGVTVGNYGAVTTEGMINIPLAEGKLFNRFAFQTDDHQGYGTNIKTGVDIDDKHSIAFRDELLLKASDRLSVLLKADYYKADDHSGAWHYFRPVGDATNTIRDRLPDAMPNTNIRDLSMPYGPNTKMEFYGGLLDINYEASDTVSLRSLTSYRHSKYSSNAELTNSGLELFDVYAFDEASSESQEFQLNINTDQHKFVAGLYGFHEKNFGYQITPTNLRLIGGDDTFAQGYYGGGVLKTTAAAFYAQDTYNVTDQLGLTLGGRYSFERKEVSARAFFDLSRPFDPDYPGTQPLVTGHHNFYSFTPKVGLQYTFSPRAMVFASWSKGFKSGTYAISLPGPEVNPEKITAYEAGMKLTTADSRFRGNITGFYYDYTDLQVNQLRDQNPVLVNAAAATLYGVEGEFRAKPLDAPLVATLQASYLHARFDKYVSVDGASPNGDGKTTVDGVPAFNLAGKPLPQSPDYTITAGLEYTIDSSLGKFVLRGESFWSDRVYLTTYGRKNESQAPYNLVNLDVNFDDKSGHWHASAFIKNVFDKTVISSADPDNALAGPALIGFLMPPRTFGASLRYTW